MGSLALLVVVYVAGEAVHDWYQTGSATATYVDRGWW